MQLSKFASILTRLITKSKTPEYNPSVLDYIPKNGLVGYTTNNPRLAFLLLYEPAERFGFHVKDFSKFGTSLDFDSKVLAAGAEQRKYDFHTMYGKSNINSGDVFNSNTVFTHQFPKNIDEARQLEQKDGGVNLFVHLEFDTNVDHNWQSGSDIRVLECVSCGKVVKNTPQLIDLKNSFSATNADIEIGEEVKCNQYTVLCDWKDNTINDEANTQENFDELHEYFNQRGLLLRFEVNSDTPLNRARVELLRKVAGCFKL